LFLHGGIKSRGEKERRDGNKFLGQDIGDRKKEKKREKSEGEGWDRCTEWIRDFP